MRTSLWNWSDFHLRIRPKRQSWKLIWVFPHPLRKEEPKSFCLLAHYYVKDKEHRHQPKAHLQRPLNRHHCPQMQKLRDFEWQQKRLTKDAQLQIRRQSNYLQISQRYDHWLLLVEFSIRMWWSICFIIDWWHHLPVRMSLFRWDKRTPLPSLKIEPKQSDINCLEYLKENCFLSGGRDGTIKFYDVRGGNSKFYTFKEHSSSVTRIKKLDGNESKESL